jgi:hypothetical protein
MAGLQIVTYASKYSLEVDRWDRLADMPTATIYPGIAYMTGKIYCIAGRTFKQRSFTFNQISIYDIQADAWQMTHTTYT